MNTHLSPALIEVGRRVHYAAGYGSISGDGLIVAVHGEPNPAPPQTIFGGIGRVIRQNDCQIDVVLFDGRKLDRINQCGIGAPGIGIKLLDRVHGPELIEVAKRNAAKRAADTVIEAAREARAFVTAEAARVIDREPLFYWNGIKDEKGAKLQRCWYSETSTSGSQSGKYPQHTITIYARDYARFSDVVSACFVVENDSDMMTDYFEQDRIRVIPGHPLYAKVKAALDAQESHRAKRRGTA